MVAPMATASPRTQPWTRPREVRYPMSAVPRAGTCAYPLRRENMADMTQPDFRTGLDRLDAKGVTERLSVYAYELNMLVRTAHALGLKVNMDTVEREGHTALLLSVTRGP